MHATHNEYNTNRTRNEISLNAKRQKREKKKILKNTLWSSRRTLFIRANNYYTSRVETHVWRENERSRWTKKKNNKIIVYLRIKSRRWRCMDDSPLHTYTRKTTHYTLVWPLCTLSDVRAYAQHVFIFIRKKIYKFTRVECTVYTAYTVATNIHINVYIYTYRYQPFRKEVHSLVVILAFRHSLTRTHTYARIWAQHMKCAFFFYRRTLSVSLLYCTTTATTTATTTTTTTATTQ